MSRQALLKELESRAAPALQGHSALSKAVELLEIINGNILDDQLDTVLRLAERIRINSLRDGDDLYNICDTVEIKPQDLVAGDFLIDKIGYWVEMIREELFGATEPPFVDDLESAINWLETTARIDMQEKNSFSASANSELNQVAAQQTSVPFLMRDIFIPAKSSIKSIWVQPGTLLYNLSRKIQGIAKATGFRPHALTVYILTGLEPVLPRVTISTNLGRADLPARKAGQTGTVELKPRKLSKRSLKIEIHTADLSPAELKTIYDQYRQELKIRKTKTLSDDQIKLFYLVRSKGGVPDQGTKAFWLMVRDSWNSDPVNKAYISWEGIYQRYKIIEKKMESLYFK
ncbi:MAG: hypothetical protein U1E11_02980 [Dethiobacteria bacterium]|nr:hypothetical protein [Dethiobacteria bacterium]